MINKEEVIGYENKDDFRGIVLQHILEMFSDKAMLKLIKMPTEKKTDKIAVGSTLDIESEKIIGILIKGRINKLKQTKPVYGKIIKPLYLFLDEEVLLYAKLKKLKFKQIRKEENQFADFLDELEKKHPEVKRAVVGSFLEMFKLSS